MEIIKLSATNSTNSYLKELSKTIGVEDGVVVVSENQQNGRGQRETIWQSEVGKSLTFSVFKQLKDLDVANQFQVSMLVGIAVYTVLNKLNIPQLSLKWPNDIMSYNKKIGGVLIENRLIGQKVASSIIGIGINCNEMQFDNLPNASSLRRISGIEYDIYSIMTDIVTEINTVFAVKDTANYNEIRLQYEPLLFRIGKVWNFQEPDSSPFNGIIKGVTDRGQLLLEVEGNEIKTYNLKEIKMIL